MTPKKPTITGVILTLNEEKDLPRALASLHWCDQLIVLDSGSVDNTKHVAESNGAQFYVHIQKPPFMISEQRNWAIHNCHVTSDWVIFLDADEEVGPSLARDILDCIQNTSSLHAYELTPRYWFLGKWLKRTQGFPNWHPRLLRRGYCHFEGGVWESFSNNLEVGRLFEPYEHYAFSKGIDDWIERHMRYATWEAHCTYEYLQTNRKSSFLTSRALLLRVLASRLWYFRPPARFLQKYIFQLGILEGWQGLLYSLLISFYDLIVVVKTIEHFRLKRGKPL